MSSFTASRMSHLVDITLSLTTSAFLFLCFYMEALGCAGRAGLEVCVLGFCMLKGSLFLSSWPGNVTMLL